LRRGPVCQDAGTVGASTLAAAPIEEGHYVAEAAMVATLLAGTSSSVIADAAELLRGEPLRERAWHLLALAHATAGDLERALATCRQARETLADALGIDPGPDLTGLETALAAGETDAELDRLRAWLGPPDHPPSNTRPMELPAPVRHFVGREPELAGLAAALGSPATRLAAVVGFGGLGKTTLAVEAARAALHHYPDGCLFIDLRGADDEPRDPVQAQKTLLVSLGIPEDTVPADPGDRAEVYRAVLRERRVLIVLDNAVDAEQIRHLAPTDGPATAIATSRSSLGALTPAIHLELAALPGPQAVDLLARFTGGDTGGDHDVLRDIAELTGRLPLALRVVGARIARRRGLDLRRMAARLTDEQRRLDELADGDRRVRSCIDVGFRRLRPEAARLLCLMAALPVADCSLELLSALADRPATETNRLARELVDAQLLREDGRYPELGPRYVVHDLVRLFARGERIDAREELARGYRLLLFQALRADVEMGHFVYVTPDRPGEPPEAFAPAVERAGRHPSRWSAAERELLTAAVGDAVDLGLTDLAWRLATAGTNYLERTVRLGDVAGMRAKLAGVMPVLSDEGRAALGYQLGKVLRDDGRNLEALAVLRPVRRAYLRLGDLGRAAAVAGEMAIVCRRADHLRVAEAAARWAIAAHTRVENPSRMVTAQHGQTFMALGGVVSSLNDDFLSATACYDNARKLFVSAGDKLGEGAALAAMGVIALRSGESRRATELQRRAAAVFDAAGSAYGALLVRHNQSECLLMDGHHQAALALGTEVLSTARELRPPREFFARILQRQATLLRVNGDLDAARAGIEEGRELVRKGQLGQLEQSMLRVLGEIHLDAGRPVEARAALERSRSLLATASGRLYHEILDMLHKIDRGELEGAVPSPADRYRMARLPEGSKIVG
ncbi:MAG TPA: BTAD domain-containing putative transcriptional regulator, partial [Phytomonospora sp.]